MAEPSLSRFYDILHRLGPPMPFASFRDRPLPSRGVYFFFEPGEEASAGRLRVVRVGTHALSAGSRSTLAQRLSQHRGSSRGGNHRGSIFRLLVGQALLASRHDSTCPSWGVAGQLRLAAEKLQRDADTLRAIERPVEASVSAAIARMSIVAMGCDDEPGPHSLRGYVERNSIALLSLSHCSGAVRASQEWLGRHSNRQRVRDSGLWNQRHVGESPDSDFLDRFENIVTLSLCRYPKL